MSKDEKAKKEQAQEQENRAPDPKAKKAPNPEELVDYTAPLLGGDKKDIFVAVNGEALRIKRGVPVKIKRKFYEALQNAASQEYTAYQTMAKAQAQSGRPAAEM